MTLRPVALAVSLCEQVIVEEETRHVTLVNCFVTRKVEGESPEAFPFTIFVSLTDGRGDVPIEVYIERLDSLEVVFRRRAMVRFRHPLQSTALSVRVKDFRFPVVGYYQVSVLADGEMIALRRFTLRTKEEEK